MQNSVQGMHYSCIVVVWWALIRILSDCPKMSLRMNTNMEFYGCFAMLFLKPKTLNDEAQTNPVWQKHLATHLLRLCSN